MSEKAREIVTTIEGRTYSDRIEFRKDLIAMISQALQDEREEALNDASKKVCVGCFKGYPFANNLAYPEYVHVGDEWTFRCSAVVIRRLKQGGGR